MKKEKKSQVIPVSLYVAHLGSSLVKKYGCHILAFKNKNFAVIFVIKVCFEKIAFENWDLHGDT